MMNAASVSGVLQILALHAAAFLALLLASAGVHKLIQRGRAKRAIHEFVGVPISWAAPLAAAAALTEVIAAALLWMPGSRALGAGIAGALSATYLLLMLRSLSQGRRDVDCGCSFGGAHHPLGAFHVARNTLLTLAAAGVALTATAAGGAPAIGAPQILAGVAMLALYAALDQVMALQPPRAGELL